MSEAEGYDARAAARAAVQAAFEKGPAGPPLRTCPTCGAQHATERAICPSCGKRYDRKLPWLSDTARWALGAAALIVVVTGCALILPGVFDARDEHNAREVAAQRALEARERARLAREQIPRQGEARELRGTTLEARAALVKAVELDILADARSRIAAKRLDGPVLRAECGPLIRAKSVQPAHEVLSRKIGRYDCVAVKANVMREGKVVALLGHPFVAAVDFERFTYVWCKDNKKPGERGKALATVPLDPACLAAEGESRIGNGYTAPEEEQ